MQEELKSSKTWSGRFSEPVHELVKQFTGSVDFDKRLALCDIRGSLAHVTMLGEAGILPADDVAAIQAGLDRLWARDREAGPAMPVEGARVGAANDAGPRARTSPPRSIHRSRSTVLR